MRSTGPPWYSVDFSGWKSCLHGGQINRRHQIHRFPQATVRRSWKGQRYRWSKRSARSIRLRARLPEQRHLQQRPLACNRALLWCLRHSVVPSTHLTRNATRRCAPFSLLNDNPWQSIEGTIQFDGRVENCPRWSITRRFIGEKQWKKDSSRLILSRQNAVRNDRIRVSGYDTVFLERLLLWSP